MLKELKENLDEELEKKQENNKGWKWKYQQKTETIKKRNKTNYAVKKYNWNKKYTRRFKNRFEQAQEKNQWIWRWQLKSFREERKAMQLSEQVTKGLVVRY